MTATWALEEMCIHSSGDEFLCSDNQLEIRRAHDGYGAVDIGVQQRVDGSDQEKESIREIIRMMNEYFGNEVLVMPMYKDVRQKCKNTNELCAFWSAVGECESNRNFMLSNCPATCRFCLLTNTKQ